MKGLILSCLILLNSAVFAHDYKCLDKVVFAPGVHESGEIHTYDGTRNELESVHKDWIFKRDYNHLDSESTIEVEVINPQGKIVFHATSEMESELKYQGKEKGVHIKCSKL